MPDLWCWRHLLLNSALLLLPPFLTLLQPEQRTGGKQQVLLPPAHTPGCSRSRCSCPRCSSYTWEPEQDLSILSSDPHVRCNPDPLLYPLPPCSRSPSPFDSPINQRWQRPARHVLPLHQNNPVLGEIPGNSSSPIWGPLPPGQCGIMRHLPLPVKGWVMSRSSCQVKCKHTVVSMTCEGCEKSPFLPPSISALLQELRTACPLQAVPWSPPGPGLG